MLELNLDFSEEDVEFISREEQRMLIDDAGSLIRRALESYAVGRVVREGLSVAIVGRPNAGKSSLLNALLGVRRAIVTDTPGTTRDYIEESLVAHGALLRFTDTAGLRESTDPIEREGIGHSISRLRAADVVALVEDLTLSGDFAEAIDEDLSFLAAHEVEPGRIVLLLNKSDLSSLPDDELQGIAALVPHPLFVTSALTGAGLDQLLRWCAGKSTLLNRGSLEGDILVTNARHADCLMRALHHLEAAKGSIASGLTEEFLSLEMRAATDALGEIIGEVTSEEILRSIFDRFCIGK
jgi:tRNA modification GTPase